MGCGSGRLAKAARRRGFRMLTLDRDAEAPEFDAVLLPREEHWVRSLRDVPPEELPTLDYVHFSPNCASTSPLAASKHRRMDHNDYQGVSAACKEWNQDMMHFCCMIKHQRSRPGNAHCAFTLEQPVGKARLTPAIQFVLEQPVRDGGLGAVRCTLDMCRHGGDCCKPTDFWVGGLPSLVDALTRQAPTGVRVPKWCCSAETPCKFFPTHPSVRGDTKSKTPFPHELCNFLMAHVEMDLCVHRVAR